MRLLIVEDSAPLAEAVARHLTAQGHAVDRAATLAEAEDAVAVAEYALILLDLGLPDGSGLGFLRARRAAQDRTPIVIATARDQISDRIAGLDAGADDYVVKPYDLEELAARIRANARRGQDSPATVIDLGGVTVDRARRRVHAGGAEVRLTQREWALFDTLLGARGRVLGKPALEDALFAFDAEIEGNAVEGRDAADLAPLDSAGLPAELAPVAANLNRYLARIQGLMTAERDFAAHAAHELRTPVAAARAEAQLLARRPEVAADAGRIVAALDRITALTERLLQLSRAESGIGLARGPVDLAALVPMALDDLPVLPGRPLGYDDGDLETAVVEGDADGIAILIRNLAENALRHGTGPVRVTLAAGPRLTVTNPVGPGARFRMGRLDRDPASEGTGLGLTIAAKLAEQSGARLTTGIAGGVATAVLDWSR